MEDEEKREDELVHLIGYFDNWQLMSTVNVKGFDVLGKTILKPKTSSKFLTVHPRIKIIVCNFDLNIIRPLLVKDKLLKFSITAATEDDRIVHMAKDRLNNI